MKQITAYIKTHRLSDVTLALHQVEGLSGMSIRDGRGFGRGRAKGSKHYITDDADNAADFIPHIRIEIVCQDGLAEQVVLVIERTAHTGLRGDGKIYVSAVEAAVRISTGERGHGVC